MRVAWLSHSAQIGGAELCLVEAADAVANDVEGVFFVPAIGALSDRAPVPLRVLPYVAATGGLRTFWSRRRTNLIALPALVRALRGFDVVVGNTATLAVGALAARLAGIPHVWYVHELGDTAHGVRLDFGRAPSREIIGGLSQRTWATSRFIARRFGSILGGAVDVIHPAPRPMATTPMAPRRAACEVVVVGSVTAGKRVADVVAAVVALKAAGHDIHLRVVGRANEDALAAVNAAARDDAVEVVGHHDDVAPFINGADVLVSAAVDEAFGRVLVEAMVAGKGVIASDSGGHGEIIEHDVSGLMFPPGDVPALTARLAAWCGDATLRARLARGAQARLPEFGRERLRRDVLAGLDVRR